MARIYGWDMSHHDWDRGLTAAEVANVKNVGISFVTHKIGEGSSYTDPKFDDFWRAIQPARRDGVLPGAYYVNWPGNQKDQAIRFVKLLDSKAPGWDDGPFILQLDSEKFEGMTRPPSYAEIRVFIAALKSYRRKHRPILYGPKWLYGDALKGVDAPLWASNYGGNPAVDFREAYPGDTSNRWDPYSGQTPKILQYGSRTIIGSQRNCDANAFRGTLAELKELVYRPAVQKPESGNDMAVTAEQIVDALMERQMGHPGQENLPYSTLLRNLHQQGKGPSFDDWEETERYDALVSSVETIKSLIMNVASDVRAIAAKLDSQA